MVELTYPEDVRRLFEHYSINSDMARLYVDRLVQEHVPATEWVKILRPILISIVKCGESSLGE